MKPLYGIHSKTIDETTICMQGCMDQWTNLSLCCQNLFHQQSLFVVLWQSYSCKHQLQAYNDVRHLQSWYAVSQDAQQEPTKAQAASFGNPQDVSSWRSLSSADLGFKYSWAKIMLGLQKLKLCYLHQAFSTCLAGLCIQSICIIIRAWVQIEVSTRLEEFANNYSEDLINVAK